MAIRKSINCDGSVFIEVYSLKFQWGFGFTSDSRLKHSFISFLHPWLKEGESCPRINLSPMPYERYVYLSQYGYLHSAS